VGILGAGLMGAGIAYVTAEAGIPARIKDKDDAALGRGLKQIASLLDEAVKRKAPFFQGARGAAGADHGHHGLQRDEDRRGGDRAVFEDSFPSKQAVLRDLEREAPNAIFRLEHLVDPIGLIAEGAQRPDQVVGMHFLLAGPADALLEVIRGRSTGAEAVRTAVALGKKIGKTVIVVNDGPASTPRASSRRT